jgi:methyl-accepting chemotaxis protein
MSNSSLRGQIAGGTWLTIAVLCIQLAALAMLGLGQAGLAASLGGAALVGFALLAAIAWRKMGAAVRLIERARDVAAQAAGGDLNSRITLIGRKDELGQLLNSVNHVLDLTEEFAKDTGAAMKMAGQGSYFRFIPPQGLRGDFQTYAELTNKVLAAMEARDTETKLFEQSVHGMVAEVSRATRGIGRTAGSMANRSESAGGRSLNVGEAAQITTGLAQAVSDATHHLASAINEIAEQVTQSQQVAHSAVSDIAITVERMNGLADSVSQIGQVVSLINDIASQTNLLALNATIEAARAGEAGKGFAVVAGEVKTLANQTAKATEDISRQVASIQDAARQAAAGVSQVVETIRGIDDITATIAGAVRKQEEVTRDISAHIEEVAEKSAQVSQNVADMSQASAEACGGTVRVIWSARTLSKVVESLSRQVEDYVSKVR